VSKSQIRGWNRGRERRRLDAKVRLTVELFGEYLADFLSQPFADDVEAQRHEWRPTRPPGNLGELVCRLEPTDLAQAVLAPLLHRIHTGWAGGKVKQGQRDRHRAELSELVGRHVHRLLLYRHLIETGTHRPLLAAITKARRRKHRKGAPRPPRGRPKKVRTDFQFDDWTDADFTYVGDWLVDCATSLDCFDFDWRGLPLIAEHWKPDIRDLYREALRGRITILPRREPPPPRAGWYNDRGIAFCNRVSSREAIEAAFRETITTVDENRIMVDDNLEVIAESVVEIEVPGNFVTQHVAGIDAMERVPLRIDPLMRDLVEQFGTDAKKRRKIGYKLERDRFAVQGDLDHADALSGESFYLEYLTDYRGRLIPASHLHFARDDRTRSLFRFANGKRLGSRLAGTQGGFTDLEMLEFNIANRYGVVDKKPWQDRLAWVHDHAAMIEKVAAKPFSTFNLWSKADEPFQFVSACREWVAARKDPDFVTTLPICWDGSANGLQHLVLLARDEAGAVHVNLVNSPNGQPQDIYLRVAKVVREKLLESADEAALWWCRRTDGWSEPELRKLFKKTVMTIPYNANRGIPSELSQALQSVRRGEKPPEGYAGYLHQITMAAVRDLMPRAMELRVAITQLATYRSIGGDYVRWISPSGFPVENRHETPAFERVYGIDGAEFTVIKAGGGNIDIVGCTNGLVPNLIHAQDSAHLVRVSCAAAAENIEIIPIHDCYATLAPDSAALHRIIRRELYLMYQNRDYLGELIAANGEAVSLPPLGTLNLEHILEAEYSFA
jgi:DNA-dependent RNA polymerase